MSLPHLILLGLIVLFIIPFFFFSYAIFLVHENKKSRYFTIYLWALVFIVPSLALMHVFFFLPPVNHELNLKAKAAEQGFFIAGNSRDSVFIYNNTFSMNFGAAPKNNFSCNYVMYPTAKPGRIAALIDDFEVYMGRKTIEVHDQTLDLLYPLNFRADAIDEAQFRKTNRNRNKFYTPPKRDICMKYTISIAGDSMVLRTQEGVPVTRLFKRQSQY